MTTPQTVRDSFLEQAEICAALGSPFTADVIRSLETTLEPGTKTGAAALDWKGRPGPKGDALALRLAAALHALVLTGRDKSLASFYPPQPAPSPETLHAAVASAIAAHDDWIADWLALPPQTNEVGRSAALYSGLMAIAAETDLPLRLLEIGSSAGLNLILDRYAYDLGGVAAGAAASPVRLAPQWRGAAPAAGPEIQISERRGCDLAPIDLRDPAARLRLKAFVWPDQRERLQRLEAAINLLLSSPPRIDREEGSAWVAENVRPRSGAVTVLMHSIVFSYLPPDAQARIRAQMEAAGADAAPEAPLAWLSFELGADNNAELTLRLWPGGEARRLARAHPHAAWIAAG